MGNVGLGRGKHLLPFFLSTYAPQKTLRVILHLSSAFYDNHSVVVVFLMPLWNSLLITHLLITVAITGALER